MKQNLVKPIQLSKQIGISRQAVSLAIKNEQLPTVIMNGKKYVDLNDSKVIEYTKGVQERKDEKGKSKNQVKPKKQKLNKKESQSKEQEKQKDESIPDDIIKKLDEGRLSAADLIKLPKITVDKIKIYEQTKQIIQKRQQERRELISVKLVHVLFGKIYDIDVNEFLAIKTRVKSHLAKIFKTNDDEKLLAAEKAIDEELWDCLRRVKYEFDKFLDKMDYAD